ncbi:unnamed protein product [Rotaria socialis]|uniref:Uncharacterized protein n=1 Tax=Rotaria socialis TaxID=392032 RepID=A0A818CT78_9BILA|nr:unnamed protein product [Rotaria socialis]CAF4358584.1 unnamed protein product [Rotaria socialis]
MDMKNAKKVTFWNFINNQLSVYDSYAGNNTIKKLFERVEVNDIGVGLVNINGVQNIKRFFQKATQEQNPSWIIKANTIETEFYTTLNKEIAGGEGRYQNERRYIIALRCHHPILNNCTFTGAAYRVLRQNNNDLNRYRTDFCLIAKSVLSSSIDRRIAELFLLRQEATRENPGVKL